MKNRAASFWEYLDIPLRGWSRIVLVAITVPLVLSFLFPLWQISMTAPQYPKGLSMDIYCYKLVGGHDGVDVSEINTLNHYIGMKTITRSELQDLDWLPFGIIAMAMLGLRCALLGNVRTLIDLAMITVYISGVAFGRFVYMLYDFGHNLDPKAPVTIDPFMPVVFGAKKVANFWTYSYPAFGSAGLGVFTGGVWVLLAFYLWKGYRTRERSGAGRAAASSA
ncbi:MAG TPA: hypothetical protein PKE00_11005 [Planctomycetota bacterium]|nr:hypothetical protein [Planctomycetota bacterium]